MIKYVGLTTKILFVKDSRFLRISVKCLALMIAIISQILDYIIGTKRIICVFNRKINFKLL
jgi:hypothetical protein